MSSYKSGLVGHYLTYITHNKITYFTEASTFVHIHAYTLANNCSIFKKLNYIISLTHFLQRAYLVPLKPSKYYIFSFK